MTTTEGGRNKERKKKGGKTVALGPPVKFGPLRSSYRSDLFWGAAQAFAYRGVCRTSDVGARVNTVESMRGALGVEITDRRKHKSVPVNRLTHLTRLMIALTTAPASAPVNELLNLNETASSDSASLVYKCSTTGQRLVKPFIR